MEPTIKILGIDVPIDEAKAIYESLKSVFEVAEDSGQQAFNDGDQGKTEITN